MRIHSDRLTYRDLIAAARVARADIEMTDHDSKSRDRAFDVHLTGESRRRPNRRGQGDPDAYAATWDQWGVFLAALYERDDRLVTPYYSDASDFADRTGDRFGAPETVMESDGYHDRFVAYGWPDDAHGDHRFKFQGVPREQRCTKCSAVTRWMV